MKSAELCCVWRPTRRLLLCFLFCLWLPGVLLADEDLGREGAAVEAVAEAEGNGGQQPPQREDDVAAAAEREQQEVLNMLTNLSLNSVSMIYTLSLHCSHIVYRHY